MSVSFARPDVTELVFHLYGRSVHPELFEVFAEAEIRLERYTASIQICDAGHVVALQHDGRSLTEVMTTRQQPLPQRRRLMEKRVQGQRHESFDLEGQMQYHVSYQVEHLEPEVFLNYHEELLIDCRRADLAHFFPAGHRLAPGPLSLIRTESDARSLLVHTFHTFPTSHAVVKTQSLIELPPRR